MFHFDSIEIITIRGFVATLLRLADCLAKQLDTKINHATLRAFTIILTFDYSTSEPVEPDLRGLVVFKKVNQVRVHIEKRSELLKNAFIALFGKERVTCAWQ